MLQKLSPQQIQLMKLLQIPTAILDIRIKEELESNPALEEGDEHKEELYEMTDSDTDFYEDEKEADDFSDDDSDIPVREDDVEFDEYLNDYIEDDPVSYKTMGESDPGEERTVPYAVENTFHEYLEQQLGMLDLEDERRVSIAKQIIGSIDDDGYLRRDPASIIDDLMFSQNINTTEEEVNELLSMIHRFDPPGIGARDLRECIILQLKSKLNNESYGVDAKESVLLALKIVEHYFEEFSKKHFVRLQRQLNVDDHALKTAVDEILKLNPKPASGHNSGNRNINYIIPDFILVNRDGELELTLNSRNTPDLRISEQYKEMIRAYKASRLGKRADRNQREAILFIKQKIDSAKWFIDAIRQRQQTMYKTMYSIMQYQYDYFLTGDQKKLRPMILKNIADMTGLDISTVSRVANSKFVQTEFGTQRLKDFFSESLQTDDGEEVSTIEVKKILTEMITEEQKRKPLSDEKLKSLLLKRGYNIARRTVAKYREQLNIPVARLRKEL